MSILKKALVTALVLAAFVAPAAFAGGHKEMGTDPVGDGISGLDLTYLQVGKQGKALSILIGLEGMLPEIGSYPDLPGIEWIFTVNGRTFIAEAVASADGPSFYLFEETGDGVYEQLESPTGTFDHADGYVSILVPLKSIGAKRGSVISGAQENDVDTHIHLGPATGYPDEMTSTGKFVVP